MDEHIFLKEHIHINDVVAKNNLSLRSRPVPHVYEYPHELRNSLLHIIAGGEYIASYPVFAELEPLPFFLLLYCVEGSVQLHMKNRVQTVSAGEAATIYCQDLQKIGVLMLPTCLRYGFIAGGECEHWRKLFAVPARLTPNGDRYSPLTLEPLFLYPTTIDQSLFYRLHSHLTTIFCTFGSAMEAKKTEDGSHHSSHDLKDNTPPTPSRISGPNA